MNLAGEKTSKFLIGNWIGMGEGFRKDSAPP